MNQAMTSARPAKAQRDADTIVEGKATFEAMTAMTKTARPMVTGKGMDLVVSS